VKKQRREFHDTHGFQTFELNQKDYLRTFKNKKPKITPKQGAHKKSKKKHQIIAKSDCKIDLAFRKFIIFFVIEPHPLNFYPENLS
jgi:hypothetical protein